MSDFEARHRSFYEALNKVFNDALFKRRFEPKPSISHSDDLHVISLPEDTGDGPTPQREAMAGDMVEEFITDSGRKIKRLLDGSVLELLNTRCIAVPGIWCWINPCFGHIASLLLY